MLVQKVKEKCLAFKDARFWGDPGKVRVRGWLNNFDNHDRKIAACILNELIFFSNAMVDKVFESSFHKLSVYVEKNIDEYGDRINSWEDFLDNAIFTRVEGENPNPTDSGNLFCRKARQSFNIPEQQIKRPAEALRLAEADCPIVFLDDFIGSGNQLLSTWTRDYGNNNETFKSKFSNEQFRSHYVCLIATKYSIDRVNGCCPINIIPTHILGGRYDIRNVRYLKVNKNIEPDIIDDFLERYTGDLVVPNFINSCRNRKYGFHSLGLTIAFAHSVPDASLPIIWADKNSQWTPLVKRE